MILQLSKGILALDQCGSHNLTETSVWSIAGEMLACILLKNLIQHIERDILSESRRGFRFNHTVDL